MCTTDIKLEIVALKLVEVKLGRDNIIRVAERFSHQFPSKIRNNWRFPNPWLLCYTELN